MTNIEFSDEELNALANLLDIAVRSQGLNVAQNALVLYNKIKNAANPNITPTNVVETPQFAEAVEAVEAAD